MEKDFKQDVRQERKMNLKQYGMKKNHTHLFNKSKNIMKLPI